MDIMESTSRTEDNEFMSKEQKNVNVSRRDFIKKGAAVGVGATALSGLSTREAKAQVNWHRVADVVVIGSSSAGLPAAIEAADQGASVIIVEANFDIGGHLILNGGQLPLGGGTSTQRKYGIEDSADRIYNDLTNPDNAQTRYNDRELARAFADNSAETHEFLLANGVVFRDQPPVIYPSSNEGDTVPSTSYVAPFSDDLAQTIGGFNGSGIARPLEASARAKGVEILLRHRMTSLVRGESGRVLGITATYLGNTVNIQAMKGVILATGSFQANVNFRRIFDPRLTEEYHSIGEAYVKGNADGQRAAMALGASLWGTAGQTTEAEFALIRVGRIGCMDGIQNWPPNSAVFPIARARGLPVADWQDAILVNQLGQRMVNEMDNTSSLRTDPKKAYDYMAALMGSVVVDGKRVGGPIWAIFDSDAVQRENWDPRPPFVDPQGYFFSGSTLAELAINITHPAQSRPMSATALQSEVAKYNSYVDMGTDSDFGKPTPRYKIQTPPFYAAWTTPMAWDSNAGIRINGKAQVIDLDGKVIPGLYAAGESVGGISMHGMPKCMIFGRIAGREAATAVLPGDEL